MSAAPISGETALKAHEIFGNATYQGYGQTEVLPIAMMGPRQWVRRGRAGLAPFAQLQIWDEDNKAVQPGEIVASAKDRGAASWNNPEATAERIVDEWVKTGDIGRLDANGYLYRLDRGFDIYPVREGRSISDGERTGRALFHSPRQPRRRSARSSARNVASRSGLLGSAGSQATDGARGTLARMSQEVRAIHLLRRVL